jgi:hypothetical protein
MSDITISTNDTKQEDKQVKPIEVSEALNEAIKIEKENERLKKAIEERENLEIASKNLGGRAYAGQTSKTLQEVAAEEAKKLLSVYR